MSESPHSVMGGLTALVGDDLEHLAYWPSKVGCDYTPALTREILRALEELVALSTISPKLA